jgi:hypothetical protein
MGRPELEVLLESGKQSAIIEALLIAAYYDPDWRWVQGVCLRFLDDTDVWVKTNAATCLGHIARIHKNLDLELVLPNSCLSREIPLSGLGLKTLWKTSVSSSAFSECNRDFARQSMRRDTTHKVLNDGRSVA